MTIKNYTHHNPLNLIWPDGHVEAFQSMGAARCGQRTVIDEAASAALGYPVTKTSFGKVEGLPKPEPGSYFIVSRTVLNACPDRSDLLAPNDIVRDETGRIVGCKSFANS